MKAPSPRSSPISLIVFVLLFIFIICCASYVSIPKSSVLQTLRMFYSIIGQGSPDTMSDAEHSGLISGAEQHVHQPFSWQYDIRPAACGDFSRPIELLIAVISKPSTHLVREAIRKTWGSLVKHSCGMHLIFVLGKVHDVGLQQALRVEARRHNDILQSNQFDDTYRSSTVKTLHLFQWCSVYCSGASYVLRIDDDVWLNLPKFHRFLKNHASQSKAIGFLIPSGAPVVRDPSHKAYVSREEYAADVYPAYMSGAVFAIPGNRLLDLLALSKTLPRIFLDDVYVVGILMPAANLSLLPMPGYAHREDFAEGSCPHKRYTAIHHMGLDHMYAFWEDQCVRYQQVCPQ